MKLAFVTALMGFALLICATINSMGKTEQTSYDLSCLKSGIDAEAKSIDKQRAWAFTYVFDRENCVVSRTDRCGSTLLYVIGSILSFLANALYALMWWSERRHARQIERDVLRS